MRKRSGFSRTKPPNPSNATEGAALVRSFAVKLFDREEGAAADWQLIAETLFKAGLDAIDQAPASDRKALMLNRLHEAAYDRIAGNRPAATATGEPAPTPRPSDAPRPTGPEL